MSDEEKQRPGHVYDPENPIPEHLRAPAEKPFKYKHKDVDSAEVAFRMRAFTWSLPGLLLGVLCGTLAALRTGGPVATYAIIGGIFVWVLGYFGGLWLSERGGRAMASLYFSSGSSTPPVRQYSLAESLIARDRIEDAVKELERCALEYPADPVPRMRLACLYRDRLQQNDQAVHWFRQTLAVANLDGGTELAATRELIEVYTHRMKQPTRALPDLARIADRHAGTPAGEWARRELAEIKRLMREEQGG